MRIVDIAERDMTAAHDSRRNSKKRAVNLSLDGALVAEARALGVNLSNFLETHLRKDLQERRAAAWREENREAMRLYNETVAKRGSFGDQFRRF